MVKMKPKRTIQHAADVLNFLKYIYSFGQEIWVQIDRNPFATKQVKHGEDEVKENCSGVVLLCRTPDRSLHRRHQHSGQPLIQNVSKSYNSYTYQLLQVFFISIGPRVEEFADPGSFLKLIDSAEKKFTFTFVFSVKELTLAELVADIQWTGGWFIGVYALVCNAAILGVIGTYKRLLTTQAVGIFTHLFWGRFVFDSIAFLFFTNAKVTTVDAWLALAVYIAVVVAWNLVGFLLFAFLENLSDQLTEEKEQYEEKP